MIRNLFKYFEDINIIKDSGVNFSKISTDTRTIVPGDLYIPLKGASFDGENFIENAIHSGAAGFLTSKYEIAVKYLDDSRVEYAAVVPDTLLSYLELAGGKIKESGCKVIAITGSSGKTTTKEMVYAVVSEKFKTHKTALNYNNEIGFCQTVFEAPKDTEVLIIEMGMRGLGEIELISKYAKPDIAIITNVGTAHIGRLGSKQNIARAKCEIAKYLNPNGIFVANNDNLIKQTVSFAGIKKYFSINDVEILEQHIGYTRFKYQGYEYELPIEGRHNVENSLAAINAGIFLDMSPYLICNGLKKFETIEKRWNIEKLGGVEIINDSYNANPESMIAAVGTILDMYNSPVLVLGDMGELGNCALKYHVKVGEYINNHPKMTPETVVVTVGNLAKGIGKKITKCKVVNFENVSEAADYLLKNKNIGNILFFKASRAMKFEDIIVKIKGELK